MCLHDPFVFTDPEDNWDEDDGYEYDDTKPAVDLDETDYMNRPDYIGIVSGVQYKLENADGVSEYALTIVDGGRVQLHEMSESDLQYLARQIVGLLSK